MSKAPAGRSALDIDLGAELLPALAEWRAAIFGWRDNPLVLLLKVRRPAESQSRLLSRSKELLLWLLIGAACFAFVFWLLQRLSAAAQWQEVLMALLLTLFCLAGLWLARGLFESTIHTLRLLGIRGRLGQNAVHFDETIQGSRISDRELVVGLAAASLPRLWLRWLPAPALALLGYCLYMLLGSLGDKPAGNVFHDAGVNSFQPLLLLLLSGPSLLVLVFWGLLSSVIYVLLLIALGRSIGQLWQAQMLAGSLTLTQLASIPLLFYAAYYWRDFTGTLWADDLLLCTLLAPAIVLAYFTTLLIFTRRRPLLRILLASLPGPAGLALWRIFAFWDFGNSGHFQTSVQQMLNTTFWYFSPAALVNPLGLPGAWCLGVPRSLAVSFQAYYWWRGPLLMLMALAILSICATAARHAVNDWRHAEE